MIDVVIIGAGPTGLAAAAECLRLGLSCRIIERKKHRQTTQSRALVVHSRTMEQLPLSIANQLSKQSLRSDSFCVKIGLRNSFNLLQMGTHFLNDTEYPYFSWIAQFDTERIIEEECQAQKLKVEYGKVVKTVEQQSDDFVLTTLEKNEAGVAEEIKSKWVIGCDGGRSITRQQAKIGMEKEVGELFLLAEFVSNVTLPGAMVTFQSQGVSALFPFATHNLYRFMWQPPKDYDPKKTQLDGTYIEKSLLERTQFPVKVLDVGWTSAFNIQYAISNNHRMKNIFLAGDAVHLHAPIGGQGMNYGIQDAINIVWKLAWVKRLLCSKEKQDENMIREAVNTILDSYETERRELADGLVYGTKLAMRVVAIRNPLFRMIRDFIVKTLVYFNVLPTLLAKRVSMLHLAYTKSALLLPSPRGRKGRDFICEPGERMPNFVTHSGELLYHCLDRTRHSFVVIYPTHDDVDQTVKAPGNLSVVIVILNNKKYTQNVYLVRPDLYVASIGNSMDDMWENVGLHIGKVARDVM